MAARSDSASRPKLSVAAPPQIPKDFQGSGNPIPLSPQWLLPKAGETKGMEENNNNLQPVNRNRSDMLKTSGNIEGMHDVPMKKDVFRPSVLDFEKDRGDRWRDEERDSISLMRKDRWKDGEKDSGDSRRADRWIENSSIKHFGESRRAPPERRIDSSNLDSNFDQRRESKWNTRWGPDDKEPEGIHEKWVDSEKSEKEGGIFHDRGSSNVITHETDDREGNQYRPWRSASSQNRGRGGPHHQSVTPSKQVSTFVYGRGRGENPPLTFPVSRGKSGSNGDSMNYSNAIHSLPFGSLGEKFESVHSEPYALRYARTKLLDVYRTNEMRSYQNIPDGFIPVPFLTLDEPLQPLALCVPNPEEMVVLKGIDIGDVVSSGAPQISWDGRTSLDTGHSRQNKLVTRNDFPQDLDETKEEGSDGLKFSQINFSDGASYERPMLYHGSQLKVENSQDGNINTGNKLKEEAFRKDGNYTEADEFPSNRESSFQKNMPVHPGATWQTLSLAERTHPSLPDWREKPNDVSFRTPEKGLLQPSKNLTNELGNSLASHLYTKDNVRSQMGEDPIIRRHLSGVLGEEHRLKKPIQASPEDLRLYYQDPSGVIQGPFTGIDIIGWFDAGYFGLDLLVRLESAPSDSPFSLLGDVMPHLRAKAKPPPGFGGPKQIEHADASTNISFSGFVQRHSGQSDMEMARNETKLRHSSGTEAENRFLESLMSSNLTSSSFEDSSFSEGMQVHLGNTSHNLPATGVDGGNNLVLMAKIMELERQKSLPNMYQYWQGRDGASMVSKSDIIQDSLTPHSKLLNPMLDNPRQTPYSQNADLMSILQGISDGPSSGTHNPAGSWSSFTGQTLSDTFQSKINMHHDKNFPPPASFGIQQQMFQLQKQPSLTNLRSQAIENPSVVSTPDKLLSSNLSQEQQLLNILQQQQLLSSNLPQDPNVLNILQQQYLLQLNSQAPIPTQQMSLLDKLVLLNQQKKQEEQQQLLRQQQLLSQVLSEYQSHQRFGDPSYGQAHTSPVPIRNAFTDPSLIQPSQEMLHNGSQLHVLNVQDQHATNVGNMPLHVTQDATTFNVSSEGSSLSLPNQIFRSMTHQRGMTAVLSEEVNDVHKKELLARPKIAESSIFPDMMSRSTEHTGLLEKRVSDSEINAPKIIEQDTEQTIKMSLTSEGGRDSELLESAEGFFGLSSKGKSEISVKDGAWDEKMKLNKVYEKQEGEKDAWKNEPSKQAVENIETREPRKVSEKKSKRQKSLKIQPSSDQGKGIAKSPQLSKHPESGKPEFSDLKLESDKDPEETLLQQRSGNANKQILSLEVMDSQQIQSSVPENFSRENVETIGIKSDMLSSQLQTGQRAWKHAPGFKAKSLLEIQEEEQKKAQTEAVVSEIATSVNSMSLSTSWTGIVGNIGEPQKVSGKPEASLNSKSKKSQLHDLFVEDVFSKTTSEGDNEVSDSRHSSSSPLVTSKHSESTDDGNFIEAKDNKKSRKKAAKAKGAEMKASLPVAAVDIPTGSSPIEKLKSTRQVQQEKEIIPTIPSGPSLSDFVFWKGESGNSSTIPAWSTDAGKVHKATSLRDIQKEQERRIPSQHPSQIPTPQKAQPTKIFGSNAPSWSASSPSKAASPISINPQLSSQSKIKGDEDLFWGPVDHAKQETQQVDFPKLATQSSWETRATLGKGTSVGSLGRQKSLIGKASESSLSISLTVQSSLRGKIDARTKHSEAMNFRDWCENECVRLIGSKDTSFLEFCLKQSRTEAELLLKENIGSYDPNHKFIDKFLNYKELLSPDVLEIAFQTQNDPAATGFSAKDVNSDYSNSGEVDGNPSLGPDKGGKKKGKKGKKVSASILGFNVVSNRIMKGEIQTVED